MAILFSQNTSPKRQTHRCLLQMLISKAQSIAKKCNLSYKKQPCCTSTMAELSINSQGNQLTNFQDITSF